MSEIPDPMFKESVKDFMVNQQFRRDYWVKGLRQISHLEQVAAIRSQKLLLIVQRSSIKLTIMAAQGEVKLTPEFYDPILDLLADHKIRSIGQIEAELAPNTMQFVQVMQVVIVFIGLGQIALVQDDGLIKQAAQKAAKLNTLILSKSLVSADIGYLTSPVTGGGFAVGRIQQQFILAAREGAKDERSFAKYAWQCLSAQGQKVVKAGKTLETADENIAELEAEAKLFIEKSMPILKALQII